ncbi:hypothetical protein J6590_039135 [Homalodisca vitripennis]|nr:hypothetical protein J6590_039135 [Homalodisca vitripennis]
MLQVREIREVREKSGKKTGLEIREKSGNPVSSQGKVREFRRWSGKNIKSLYTNKLTAAAPSPSLQTTLFSLNTAFFHPLIAKNPGDCVEKSQGKMKNLVWKSGKSQGISLLDSCSNPEYATPLVANEASSLRSVHFRDIVRADSNYIPPAPRVICFATAQPRSERKLRIPTTLSRRRRKKEMMDRKREREHFTIVY